MLFLQQSDKDQFNLQGNIRTQMIKTNNFGYGFKHSMSKLKHKTKHDDWS